MALAVKLTKVKIVYQIWMEITSAGEKRTGKDKNPAVLKEKRRGGLEHKRGLGGNALVHRARVSNAERISSTVSPAPDWSPAMVMSAYFS